MPAFDFIAVCCAPPSDVAAHAVELAAGDVPEWVHLIPAGQFKGRDGRGPYRLADAQAVIAATRSHHSSADIPVDYDHALIYRAPNGEPAIAAGWIKDLAARADGIWGRVEWTERAAAHLRGREYRYLSPVFTYAKDGTVGRLLSVGLTNQPNLELTSINSITAQGDFQSMEELLKLLRDIYGLPAEATQDQIVAHARSQTAAVNAHRAELTAVARALNLDPAATGEQIAVAAQQAAARAQPDPREYVSVNQYRTVSDQLAALQRKVAEDEAGRAVDQAVADGKITPAMKDWAVNYAATDLAGFKAYVEKAPRLVETKPGPAGDPPKGEGKLSDDELAVCSQLGLTEDEYLKNREAK